MTKQEKAEVIEQLTEQFNANGFFYITDSSGLTVAEVNNLRRKCFEKGVGFKVAKNTLIKKAMDAGEADYENLYDLLKGPTALMFTQTANMPGKVIKEFRESSEKPILKGAWIDSSVYIGDDSLNELSKLKSKEELIGEIIGLLQSPVKNVLSSLQSGGQTLSGLVKALEERAQ